jgi:hypothetical protein
MFWISIYRILVHVNSTAKKSCIVVIKSAIQWIYITWVENDANSTSLTSSFVILENTVWRAGVDRITVNMYCSTNNSCIVLENTVRWVWVGRITENSYCPSFISRCVIFENTVWWVCIVWIIFNTYSSAKRICLIVWKIAAGRV